ncbi:MAG: CopD family protein, partial [Pseudomonadota bacterium]
ATLSTAAFRGALYQPWMHLKLLLVAAMIAFHVSCWRWIVRLGRGQRPATTRGLRWYNEIPVLFLFGIVILAVVRPF